MCRLFFIYAYPPLRMLLRFHRAGVVALIIAAVAFVGVGRMAWLYRARIPQRLRDRAGYRVARFLWWQLAAVPAGLWALLLLLALVFVLPFPIKSLTEWAAQRAAAGVDLPSTILTPKVEASGEHSSIISELFGQLQKKGGRDNDDRLVIGFKECRKRDELGLIFSSEGHYYLLCRASLDPTRGSVFEVTAKEGLVSVRSVHR